MADKVWVKKEVASIEDHSHDNHNFQSYSSIKESEAFVSSFGNKGRELGEFQDVKDVNVISKGKLLVTDHVNSRIHICNTSGRVITMFSGDYVINPCSSVMSCDNNVVFTSCRERNVIGLNSDGEKIFEFGKDLFMQPSGLAIDEKGQIIVTDASSGRVSMHEAGGKLIRYLGENGSEKQKLSKPQYVCISSTKEILVSDSGSHSIKMYNQKGDFVKSFGGFGKKNNQFKCPHGICTNGVGEIFVADRYNNRISVFNQDGIFLRHIVTSEDGLVLPQGVAIDNENHLYVSHGHLKASEILTFKISKSEEMMFNNVITHV